MGESVEAMRKRATLRLIGAAVLVLAGVIGFPLLFDSQPRPIPVNVAIEIPDKAKVKPLPAPAVSAPPMSAMAMRIERMRNLRVMRREYRLSGRALLSFLLLNPPAGSRDRCRQGCRPK